MVLHSGLGILGLLQPVDVVAYEVISLDYEHFESLT